MELVGTGPSAPGPRSAWSTVAGDSAVVAVGGTVAGGFGLEAATALFVGDETGSRWFLSGFAVGVALIALGLWLRTRARRPVRLGIVVTARDGRYRDAGWHRRTQQAESFSVGRCAVTLGISATLPDDGVSGPLAIDRLADETITAMTLAERLAPDATRIDLIPTMRLHVAFWFGAALGHTHSRELHVHAIRQADGAAGYFAGPLLRAVESPVEPLTVGRLEVVEGGDPTKAALALDLQGFGGQFLDPVRAACRRHGIKFLLPLRIEAPRLSEDAETFTGAVAQACRVWRTADLPPAARTGRHAIFLSGPAAISVALGARLAAATRSRWTAFTFDAARGGYEPFPPAQPG